MLNFINDDVFNIKCDLFVVPVSTVGTISRPFRNGLEKLFSSPKWEGGTYNLGDVEIVEAITNSNEKKYIALACSVEEYSSSYFAIRKIAKNLAIKAKALNIKEIATPILGTGAGKLDSFFSRNIMLNAFYEVDSNVTVALTFCTPDKEIFDSFEGRSLDRDTSSGQLVIAAEIPYILQNNLIREIQSASEFYYGLAEEKFQEYLDYQASSESFYTKLENDFKSSALAFQDFLSTLDKSKDQYQFVTLCGELIAYIDYHAYRKNIWNQYPDKRVLARSAVRQHNWLINLLRFKKTRNVNTLSLSIGNALKYLKDPARNITMLSERHRVKVYTEILLQYSSDDKGLEDLILAFKGLGFATNNPKNFGALCSRILYLPNIKQIWFDSSKHIPNSDNILDAERENSNVFQASLLIESCLNSSSIRLDLGNCGLTDLALLPELFECVHLEELILSNEWPVYINDKWTKATSKNEGGGEII